MDDQTADFFATEVQPQPIPDEPIIMGPPPGDDGYDFAGAPPTESDGVIVLEDPSQFAAPTDASPFGAPVMADDDGVIAVEEVIPVEDKITPMQQWNNEWQVTLRERKDEENAAKAKQVEEAQTEMENFQAQREVKREAKMARNRADEQQKLEAMEADLENDNSWQRVVKLVDFQQEAEEDGHDITRMRDVMISLKNSPEKAGALS